LLPWTASSLCTAGGCSPASSWRERSSR
jgi:hypothetical protein